MNGFRAELFDKIVGLNGHAVVQGYDGRLDGLAARSASAARRTPGVTAALPLIEQPLMASANGRVEGVLVRGMRLEDLRTNPTIAGNVKSGDLRSVTPGSGRIAIGSRLAETLGAFPGSEISLISPEGRSDRGRHRAADRLLHRRRGVRGRRLRLRQGVRHHADGGRADPADARRRGRHDRGPGRPIPTRSSEILAPLQPMVRGRGVIVDWRQMNSALFEALEIERVAMFVVLSLIVLVAVFNILSSLIMLVRAKTRDIAILRTMGASRAAMMKMFMTVGVTIGSLGIVARR